MLTTCIFISTGMRIITQYLSATKKDRIPVKDSFGNRVNEHYIITKELIS